MKNKVKMARNPGKKRKENPVGCTGEGKKLKGNIREGKTGTALEMKENGNKNIGTNTKYIGTG